MYEPEIRKRAIALYNDGLSAREVADRLRRDGASKLAWMTVSRWVKRQGQARPVGGPRAPIMGEDTRSLYDGGMLVSEIASRFRVSPSTVRQRLQEAGTTMRPSGTLFAHRLTNHRLTTLYAIQGRTAPSIARQFGCSVATVYRMLKVKEIPRRRRGSRSSGTG